MLRYRFGGFGGVRISSYGFKRWVWGFGHFQGLASQAVRLRLRGVDSRSQRIWEFPTIRGTLYWGPYNKDPTS